MTRKQKILAVLGIIDGDLLIIMFLNFLISPLVSIFVSPSIGISMFAVVTFVTLIPFMFILGIIHKMTITPEEREAERIREMKRTAVKSAIFDVYVTSKILDKLDE